MTRYGVSYFGVRDPRHAARDLDEIAAAGFRHLTHTLSEYDLRYHLEDVARLVQMSRDRGLEVGLDPWGVGGIFGGEAYSELALVELDCRQRNAAGVSVPAACPAAPATRALLRRWTAAALELAPDVLFWDEPHFYLGHLRDEEPSPCCRCDHCAERWRERTGEALPPEGSDDLRAFRAEIIVDLLRETMARVPDTVGQSVCLLPQGEFAAGTDAWSAFAELPGLTRLGTDPYWMDRDVVPAEFVRRHIAPLRAECERVGVEMEVWIQAIRIRAGRESDVRAAAAVAAELGADIVSFWSFRGTERMAWLRSDDPDATWRAMCDAIPPRRKTT